MFDECICVTDLEPCRVQSQEIRRARKSYKCEECRCTIRPGDRYEYWSGISEGRWSHIRTCLTCCKIRNDLFKCGWYVGEMWNDIHEQYCGFEDDECICPR